MRRTTGKHLRLTFSLLLLPVILLLTLFLKTQFSFAASDYCITGDPSFCAAPLNHWKLDDGSGTTATDGGTSPKIGTLTNGPIWTAGKFGSALSFNGVNQYVQIGSLGLAGKTALTIESWVKRQSLNSFVTLGEQTSTGGITIEALNDGTIASFFDFNNGAKFTLNDTNWHHVAFVFDGTQTGNTNRLKAYLDGVAQTLTYTGTIPSVIAEPAGTNFEIGDCGTGCNEPTTGLIDDVRVFGYARTAAQIQQIDFLGLGGAVIPTPTPTPSPVPTPSPAPSPTPTPAATPTPSPSLTPGVTPTPVPSPSPTPGAVAFPLKASVSGRYLVDQNNVPFLVAGDSPQAILSITPSDQAIYLTSRKAAGINAIWADAVCSIGNGICPSEFTYAGAGIPPFTGKLADGLTYDLSKPNDQYFAITDAMVNLAAQNGMVVFLDPLETSSWLATIKANDAIIGANGKSNAYNYGAYLGTRYKTFPNIIWFSGNDFQTWATAADNNAVVALAQGIKSTDTSHLQTIELDFYTSGSLEDTAWYTAIGSPLAVNSSYSYYPQYAQTLTEYNRSPFAPVYFVEGVYEFQTYSSGYIGPYTLRNQEYWTQLSGTTGQLFGDANLYGFVGNWKSNINPVTGAQVATGGVAWDQTVGIREFVIWNNFFKGRAWWNLIPDQNHTVATAGYGNNICTISITNNALTNCILNQNSNYVTTARSSDGSLILSYLPYSVTGAVTIDMTKMVGSTTARWFDPTTGAYTAIAGSPFPNTGSVNFTPPAGNHSDGTNDWLLVLEAGQIATPSPTPIASPSPTPACLPNCAGKVCGTDGCGGSCGACGAGFTCSTNQTACLDTQAPTVPTNLSLSSATLSSITFSWSPSTDNATVSGYRIFRSGAPIATNSGTLNTTFTDTGLASSSTYTYQVSAFDPSGNASALSFILTASTLSQGPVAAYGFNEGAGTIVHDSAGANTGSVTTPLWSTSGKYGKALSFGSLSNDVIVPDAPALDFTSGMTLEAWVYPTSGINNNAWRTVIFKERPSGMVYSLYANGTSNLPYTRIFSSAVEKQISGTGALPTNVWTHLAATFDGLSLKLYKNAVLQNTLNYSGSITASNGNLDIGGNPVSNQLFKGKIDEIRLYNRALSPAEIQADMNTPI